MTRQHAVDTGGEDEADAAQADILQELQDPSDDISREEAVAIFEGRSTEATTPEDEANDDGEKKESSSR